MKIEKKTAKIRQVDLTELYLKLVDEDPERHIFIEEFGDSGVFIFKTLGRRDYRQIVGTKGISNCDKEEIICSTCTLYPENYDFENCEEAGLPTALAKSILEKSMLTDSKSLRNLIYHFRTEMNEDYNKQVSCVIHEAFPEYKLDGDDGIENWDIIRTAEYMAKAEFILHSLRMIPLAQADVTDGYNDDTEQEEPQQPQMRTERVENNSDGSQTRVSTNTINARPRVTPEKLAQLQRIAPGIDWAEDLGSLDFDTFSEITKTKGFDDRAAALIPIDGSEDGQEALPLAVRNRFKVVNN